MNLSVAEVRQRIFLVRGHQVVLDSDLAEFYQTETRLLNRAVHRNRDRFPPDFVFALTKEEYGLLKSQVKHGGRRSAPSVFTEFGVSMLSSVLTNDRAVQVNIVIMRSFAEVRATSSSETDSQTRLTQIENKLGRIEQKYDEKFEMLFRALNHLSGDSGNYLPNLGKSFGQQKQIEVSPYVLVEDNTTRGLLLDKATSLKSNAIHEAVSKYFGLEVSNLRESTRTQVVVLARQIAIYLIRKHLGSSFKEISIGLGLKDHTTALHAYRKISVAVEKNETIREAVIFIQHALCFESSDGDDCSRTRKRI